MLTTLRPLVVALVLITTQALAAHAAKPALSWQPEHLDLILARGEIHTASVTVVSDRTLTDVTLSVVPELQPFVTVSPSTLSVMNAGVPVPLEITIQPSPTAALARYDGAIHIRSGRRTLPHVLHVALLIGEEIGLEGGTLTSEDSRARLHIPEGAVIGDPLTFTIERIALDEFFPPPWGDLIGPAYDIGPDGAEFIKPLTLTLSYLPEELPLGFDETGLRIGRKTPEGDLFGLDGFVVNPTQETVSVDVWHFTRFVVIGPPNPDAPDPPTNVTATVAPSDPSQVDIDWDNPTQKFDHAKIYRSGQVGDLGDALVTELRPPEAPPYTDTMEVGLNCYTVKAVSISGDESPGFINDEVCAERGDFGPGDVFYVVIPEGNPGIAGDTITVFSSGGGTITGGNPVPFWFQLDPAFSLADITNGFTVSVFSPDIPANGNVTMQVDLAVQFQEEQCNVGVAPFPQTALALNGAVGHAVSISQTLLNQALATIISQCDAELHQLVVHNILLRNNNTLVYLSELDALAIGIGEDVFPTATTPPPSFP